MGGKNGEPRRAGRSPVLPWLLAFIAWGPSAAVCADAFWTARDDANPSVIDHSAWQEVLDAHLRPAHPSGINRFDYGGLQADADRSASLAAYIQQLQAIDPRRYSGAEQKAYWINFYNALTVQLVANAYPVDSIRDMGDDWFTPGPWNDVHANVAGQALTLNDIEHAILRPIWQDNRIHYAVNCASFGCPNLAPQAYTGANTAQLLEDGAKAYVNHPRGATLENGTVTLSSIYDWYQEDFGNSEAGVLEHLAKYAEPNLAARLRAFEGDIDYAYDWALNAP